MDEAIWRVTTVLLLAAVIFEGLILVGVMRQVGSILMRIAPARPGEVEGGPDLGIEVDIPGLASDRAGILLFLSPDCGVCDVLLPVVPTVVRSYPELSVFVVPEKNDQAGDTYREIAPLVRGDLSKLFADWEVSGTPFAVGLDPDHAIRLKGVVNNLEQLEALAEAVLRPVPEAVEKAQAIGLTAHLDGEIGDGPALVVSDGKGTAHGPQR